MKRQSQSGQALTCSELVLGLLMVASLCLTGCGPSLFVITGYPGQQGKHTNGFAKLEIETLVTGAGAEAGLWTTYASYDNMGDEFGDSFPRVIRTYFLPGATTFSWEQGLGEEEQPAMNFDNPLGRLVYQSVYCKPDDPSPCAINCDRSLFGSCEEAITVEDPVEETDGSTYSPLLRGEEGRSPHMASARPPMEAGMAAAGPNPAMRQLQLVRSSRFLANGSLEARITAVSLDGQRLDLASEGMPIEIVRFGKGIKVNLDHPAARRIARFIEQQDPVDRLPIQVELNQETTLALTVNWTYSMRDSLRELARSR